MAKFYDIGTGFQAGLSQGLALGTDRRLREEMRRQQLEDMGRREALDLAVRQIALSREDARYRDQQDAQRRAEAAAQRRLDMTAPAASLAFLRADAQGGPLTAADAAREQALTPLAFQQVQQEEEARRRQAELDAGVKEYRQSQVSAMKARAAEANAGRFGAFVGGVMDNSRLGQAMRDLMSRKPPRPEMEEVQEKRVLEDGTEITTKRRQPVGAPATKAPAVSPAASNPYIMLAGKDRQAEEAAAKKLEEDRKKAQKEAEAAQLEALRQRARAYTPQSVYGP